MSRSYLFLAPQALPLTPEQLSEETVRPFPSPDLVRAGLATALPDLVWSDATPDGTLAFGVATRDRAPYECSVRPDATAPDGGVVLSVRCSGRVDSAAFIQALCDATGWVAFDDRPQCFQPHRPPMPA